MAIWGRGNNIKSNHQAEPNPPTSTTPPHAPTANTNRRRAAPPAHGEGAAVSANPFGPPRSLRKPSQETGLPKGEKGHFQRVFWSAKTRAESNVGPGKWQTIQLNATLARQLICNPHSGAPIDMLGQDATCSQKASTRHWARAKCIPWALDPNSRCLDVPLQRE